MGAGPSEPKLRGWAAKYGDRMHICNTVKHDQVPAYLNAMDVLCAPQSNHAHLEGAIRPDGRGGVRQWSGVFGSDSGEIPLVVGDAGLIVGESDVAGWAEAISTLLEDRPRREELGARGLQRATSYLPGRSSHRYSSISSSPLWRKKGRYLPLAAKRLDPSRRFAASGKTLFLEMVPVRA